jgi:O-antigen/teichoic acid export membrane protein
MDAEHPGAGGTDNPTPGADPGADDLARVVERAHAAARRRALALARVAEPAEAREDLEGRPGPGNPRMAWGGESDFPAARAAGRAARLIVSALFANRAGSLVVCLALAAMMSPREFGAAAVALVALYAIRGLDQYGVGRTIALWRGDVSAMLPTATAMSAAINAAVYAGIFAWAHAFAAAMGAPDVTRIVRLLALNVLVSGVLAAPTAALRRESPAKADAVEQVDTWLGVVSTIGYAAAGHGLTSIAAGRLTGCLAAAFLLVVLDPGLLRIGFRPRYARELLAAALPLATSGFLMYAVTNVDQIVVGVLLHASDLGFYLLALAVAGWPLAVLTQPLRAIAPAALARFRRTPRVLGSTYLSLTNLLLCITLPFSFLISTAARSLVDFAFGPQWVAAAQALRWVVIVAALRILFELACSYATIRFSIRMVLFLESILLVMLVPALLLGTRTHGIGGAGFTQMLALIAIVGPFYLWEAGRAGLRARSVVSRLAGWALVTGAVAWVAITVHRELVETETVHLAALAAAAVSVMSLLVFRMRASVSAFRRVGSSLSARSASWADAMIPWTPAFFETAPHPVISPMLAPPRSDLTMPLPQMQLPKEGLPKEGPPAEGLPAEQAPARPDGLARRVSVGARWSVINTAVLRVANFATGVILARFVFGPRAFGLYAVSQVVLLVFLSANELGVSLAIVRWQEDVRTFGRTVVTMSVASSSLLYVVLYVSAPYIARTLGSPGATAMVRLMCVCVVIDGLACVPLALLNREFLQARRMLADSLNFAVSTGMTLWLAFAGKGAISFAWGATAGNTVELIAATLLAPVIILPGWNRSYARGLLRFGLPLAGASLLALGVFNVDSAIVGATLGPAALGMYQIAFNISSWPVNSILQAAQRVSFAGFSRVAESKELLSDAFGRAIGLVMTLTVPACVLLSTLAAPLIGAVYGDRWLKAAPALTLLAILALLRVGYGIVYDCLAAGGKRPALLAVQGLWLAALVPMLLAGAKLDGITGVAVGHVIVAVIVVGPAFLWVLTHGITTVRSIILACWRPVLGGALMAGVCEVAVRYLGGGWLGIGVAAVTGAAVYAPVVYPMRRLLPKSAGSVVAMSPADAA